MKGKILSTAVAVFRDKRVNDVINNHSVWVSTSWVGMDHVMYCDTCTQVNDVISPSVWVFTSRVGIDCNVL